MSNPSPTYEIAYYAAAGAAGSLRKDAQYAPPEIAQEMVSRAESIERAWNAMDWQTLVGLRVLSQRQATVLAAEVG